MAAEMDTCYLAEDRDDEDDDDDEPSCQPTDGGIENCAYGILKGGGGSPELDIMRNWNNGNIKSVLKVTPADLASQLTLLDMPIFSAIKREELTHCAWSKKNKATIAPNVVAFTRRFNQVSFWTVQEILTGTTAKKRVEILVHFIKVAKNLYKLNNLHSLFAVVSGLQHVSIFRLSKTWKLLTAKEKGLYDRLANLFNDNNNWIVLRDYLKSRKPPCIPFLGIFLTDLVYLDVARNMDETNRSEKTNKIIDSLLVYQSSDYSYLQQLPVVQEYLMSVRYIEELQKFHEDDQYSMSKKLEPPSDESSASGSRESVKVVEVSNTSNTVPPISGGSFRTPSTASSFQFKFTLGHRKSQSLDKFQSASLPRDFHRNSYLVSSYLNFSNTSGSESENQSTRRVNLLDDTVSENVETCDTYSLRDFSCFNYGAKDPSTVELLRSIPNPLPSSVLQSTMRRKPVLRKGRKPIISRWHKYWVHTWADHLIYYDPKVFKGFFGVSRNDYLPQPCIVQSMENWTTTADIKENSDSFLMANVKEGNVYKIKLDTPELALRWFNEVCSMMRLSENLKTRETTKDNLMVF